MIYIDHYGNAVTGILVEQVNIEQGITIKNNKISYAETFSCVNPGEYFWYCNANGLLEIAARKASATDILRLGIGTKINIL